MCVLAFIFYYFAFNRRDGIVFSVGTVYYDLVLNKKFFSYNILK